MMQCEFCGNYIELKQYEILSENEMYKNVPVTEKYAFLIAETSCLKDNPYDNLRVLGSTKDLSLVFVWENDNEN